MQPIPQNTQDEFAQITQKRIPFDVSHRMLPGVRPLDPDEWIDADDAFDRQMAYRAHLLDHHRHAVLQLKETAFEAALELLELVLDLLQRRTALGFVVQTDQVIRPDRVTITIDRADPLGTLGHLVQEDFCLLQKSGAEHVLTGAVLCFPASWTLAEKFDRPLSSIHDPVLEYDTAMARRVQRLFDGVRVDRPLWRFNRLWYRDADLYQPRTLKGPTRPIPEPGMSSFFRSEKQCILRLPRTSAVVFSIHTYVLAQADAPPQAFAD